MAFIRARRRWQMRRWLREAGLGLKLAARHIDMRGVPTTARKSMKRLLWSVLLAYPMFLSAGHWCTGAAIETAPSINRFADCDQGDSIAVLVVAFDEPGTTERKRSYFALRPSASTWDEVVARCSLAHPVVPAGSTRLPGEPRQTLYWFHCLYGGDSQ